MRLTFIGDIFPADESFCVGFGIHSQFQKHWGDEWKQNVEEITQGADYAIGNLESPLIPISLALSDEFYGHPRFAKFMKECGVNVLNVANNHILEHGERGYRETINVLKINGISVIGDADNILYLQENNCTVAIAGFCDPNLIEHHIKGTLSTLTKESIFAALNAMQVNHADIKIFCFHWGDEYIHKPSPQQIELAKTLIDAGADIVIGHHPHVIQPYEQYGKGHIFYSLGNFCFNNLFQSKGFARGMGVSINIDTANKSVASFTTTGIRLSNKELMHKEKKSAFNSYFNRIQNSYSKVRTSMDYKAKYHKEAKQKRLQERICMKTSLLGLYFALNFKDKKRLINNITKLVLKKLHKKNV